MADLTSSQAAVRLGVALNTLHRLANAGEVPCYRTAGGHRRFREEDVEGAIERRAVGEVANADIKAEAWNRVWKPACAAAGVEANPYDGRHSYASLLIHEGRSPLAVAAAMGHSSAETTWRHHVHLFEGARHLTSEPMEEAIARVRVRRRCDAEPKRHLRLVS